MALRNNPGFDVFDTKVLEETYKCFYAFAVEFAKSATAYGQENSRKVRVDVSSKLIYEVFVSAYTDIARYKFFHLDDPKNEKSDAVKRSAYSTKWIVRLRPLLVIDQEDIEDQPPPYDPLLMINEDFALQWSVLCIAQDNGLDNMYLRRKVYMDLLYDFHFREITGDGWLTIYQLLDDVAGARNENPIIEFPVL